MREQLRISRWYQPDCTVSRVSIGAFRCVGLELPWKNNAPYVSCVPEGLYPGRVITSPSNGRCIELLGVPERAHIQIHRGNYTRDIRGCILVGKALTYLDGDGILDVTDSVNTLNALLLALPTEFDVVLYSDKGVYP